MSSHICPITKVLFKRLFFLHKFLPTHICLCKEVFAPSTHCVVASAHKNKVAAWLCPPVVTPRSKTCVRKTERQTDQPTVLKCDQRQEGHWAQRLPSARLSGGASGGSMSNAPENLISTIRDFPSASASPLTISEDVERKEDPNTWSDQYSKPPHRGVNRVKGTGEPYTGSRDHGHCPDLRNRWSRDFRSRLGSALARVVLGWGEMASGLCFPDFGAQCLLIQSSSLRPLPTCPTQA